MLQNARSNQLIFK